MDRIRSLPIGLTIAVFSLLCMPLMAQSANDGSANLREGKPIIQVEPEVPFALGRETPEGFRAVEFRSPAEMSQQDRDIEAGAESSIAERAGFEDLQFNQGKWSYRQIACAALPGHLFLRFTRNNGVGDQSVFSVAIPRDGGRVRIVPILRRSYSLWSPAPINAITISVFNHIRRDEGAGASSDWYATAMCYAALAGADPEAKPMVEDKGERFSAPALAEMEVPIKGGAVIRFTDQNAQPKPTLWTMTFNPKGKLLKVKHERAELLEGRMVPASERNAVKPIPETSKPPFEVRPIEVKSSAKAEKPIPR